MNKYLLLSCASLLFAQSAVAVTIENRLNREIIAHLDKVQKGEMESCYKNDNDIPKIHIKPKTTITLPKEMFDSFKSNARFFLMYAHKPYASTTEEITQEHQHIILHD